MRTIKILLVEDNLADSRLIQEALKEGNISHTLYSVKDGVQAMDFLFKRPPFTEAVTPDVVLLDLNIPRKSGQEVLQEIKQDATLKAIPVVVITTSSSEQDVAKTYASDANCYITKPVDFAQFAYVIKIIDDFWLSSIKSGDDSSEPGS
ncbi:response regulator [Rhodocytophaga aerolata]|uniref:Response regulator n=1 Tax=Rhodocytophaga aerolata TaxID=455078 RepID=A0ABT8RFJ3_9BACT|nr:response regulator [Rhodocytophaga aerolata]MDO1450099.1 response regulator [Rhodocytophaga aerolata]